MRILQMDPTTILFILSFYAGTSVRASMESEDYMELRNERAIEEQEIATKLLRDYDKTVRPRGPPIMDEKGETLEPVRIHVTVWLIGLSSFNDVTMEFTAQIRFQQEWLDPRLKFDSNYTGPEDFINLATDQILWHPDTFFHNEQMGHVHLIDQPNQFVKIREDGWVRYNKRLTMSFSCPMNLELFPHDNQTCVIEFGSYAYTESDIILRWSDENVVVEKSANDSLPKFSIKSFINETCTSHTATGRYGCLGIRLFLQREFSYFLLQLYIPSCMLVSVSCVSFWIDWRSAPARVPLTIVTLLTITTQSHGINANLPPVSYTKAIDIWIGACVVFIFGSLIEYAIVNYIGSNEEKVRAKLGRSKEARRQSRATCNNVRRASVYSHVNSGPNCVPNSTPSPNVALMRYYGGWNCIEFSQKADTLSNMSGELSNIYGPCEKYQRKALIGANNENHLFSSFFFSQNGSESLVAHWPFGLRFRRGDKRREKREYRREQVSSEGDCFDASEYAEYCKAKLYAESTQPVERSDGVYRSRRRSTRAILAAASFQGYSRAERIDMFSRILFPIGFVAFNIVYWSLYLPAPF